MYDRRMAQPVQCLPSKHEDLRLGFQDLHKKSGRWGGCTCNSRARKKATEESLGKLLPSIQENWIISSRFNEKLNPKNKLEINRGSHPTWTSSHHMQSMYMNTSVHTYRESRGRKGGRREGGRAGEEDGSVRKIQVNYWLLQTLTCYC